MSTFREIFVIRRTSRSSVSIEPQPVRTTICFIGKPYSVASRSASATLAARRRMWNGNRPDALRRLLSTATLTCPKRVVAWLSVKSAGRKKRCSTIGKISDRAFAGIAPSRRWATCIPKDEDAAVDIASSRPSTDPSSRRIATSTERCRARRTARRKWCTDPSQTSTSGSISGRNMPNGASQSVGSPHDEVCRRSTKAMSNTRDWLTSDNPCQLYTVVSEIVNSLAGRSCADAASRTAITRIIHETR